MLGIQICLGKEKKVMHENYKFETIMIDTISHVIEKKHLLTPLI